MKEAMWGVGLILLGIFGFFLINIFGNITVTNQQNYTTMKNAVQAAMYDSLDMAKYRAGFCLCTDKSKDYNTETGTYMYTFEKSDDYAVYDIVDGMCPYFKGSNTKCEIVKGEYIIKKDVFAESLVRRFAESVTSSKNYQVIVDDVIEYPPKAKVTIKSQDNYDFSYSVVNEIDAMLEEKKDTQVTKPDTDSPTAHFSLYAGKLNVNDKVSIMVSDPSGVRNVRYVILDSTQSTIVKDSTWVNTNYYEMQFTKTGTYYLGVSAVDNKDNKNKDDKWIIAGPYYVTSSSAVKK